MGKPNPYIPYDYHRSDGPEIFRGFGGIDARIAPEFASGNRPRYALNMTTRLGMFGNKVGYLNTRHGFADQPKHGFPTWSDGGNVGDVPTANVVRLQAKWSPLTGDAPAGQLVRLVGATFQYNNNDGTGWHTPAGADALNATHYPQWLVFGAPGAGKKLFVFVDQSNGLCLWDGTNFWEQSVPLPGGGNATGFQWVAEQDGRLFVGGDNVDVADRLIVHYCKAGDAGDPTDPTDTVNWSGPFGGFFPCYAGNRFSEGTRTTGIISDRGRLWVFTENGRYVVTDAGLAEEHIDFYPDFGCISGKTMWSSKGSTFWVDKSGAYEWTGGGNPRDISGEIFPLLSTYLRMKNAAGDYVGGRFFSFVWLDHYITVVRSVMEGATGDELNTWLVYDLITRGWQIWPIQATCAAVYKTGLDMHELYFCSPVNLGTQQSPQYYTYSFGKDDQNGGLPVYSDNGSDIYGLVTFGKDAWGAMYQRKQYHFLRTRVSVSGTSGTIGMKANYYIDDDDELIGQITMTNGTDQVISGSLGADKVTNGNFTGNATGWTLAGGWTYNANAVNKDSNGVGTLSQDCTEVAGETYIVQFTITGMTVGTVTPSVGGTSGIAVTANGTYKQLITAATTANLTFTPSNTARFTIDTVSMKKLTGTTSKFTRDFLAGQNIITRAQRAVTTLPVIASIENDAMLTLTSNFTGTTETGDYCKPGRFTYPTDPTSSPFHKMVFNGRPYGYFCTLEFLVHSQRQTSLKALTGLAKPIDVDKDTPNTA